VYLQELISYAKKTCHTGLAAYIRDFLDNTWSLPKPGVMGRAVNAAQDIQRSVKTVGRVVTDVPLNIARNVDHLFDGITKAFITKDMSAGEVMNSSKVGASIEENEDNIPLRITLLFLDEVFDLAERNMWLRRQSITVLRQIINHMFGDIVNKKIVDYFSALTSEEAVSSYLTSLKEALWPDGQLAAPAIKREEVVKQRCRVAARASLLAALPDELRRVIGSETSRTGLVMLFEMLQNKTLNRRLAIVILEGILCRLFPDHKFKEMIENLHSRSEHIRNDLKSSQRTASDLRQRI
jgi:sorting nexin-13